MKKIELAFIVTVSVVCFVNALSLRFSDQSCCSVRLPCSAQRSEQHVLSGQHGQWRCRAYHRSVITFLPDPLKLQCSG